MSEYNETENLPQSLVDRIKSGMGCGSYVMTGWRDIILRLDEQIAEIDPDYKVDQIKEKFGGLRYYVTLSKGITDDQQNQIWKLIEDAEALSYKTCDVCGKPGKCDVQNRMWMATRCEEHQSK